MAKQFDLTREEKAAIAALKRLEKKWPSSLWLFSGSGELYVMKKNAEAEHAMIMRGGSESVDQEYVVGTIFIENDGGDW